MTAPEAALAVVAFVFALAIILDWWRRSDGVQRHRDRDATLRRTAPGQGEIVAGRQHGKVRR